MIEVKGSKIAVAIITDPDKTAGAPSYTPEEIKLFEASGGFKNNTAQLIIPDEAKERSDQGIVKYVGPDVKDVKIGDYVIFSGYTGTTVQLTDPDEVLVIFDERFVLAIIGDSGGAFDNVPVPGLYFRVSATEYIVADYEIAMGLITDAVKNSPLSKGTKVLTKKPDINFDEVQ